MLVNSPLVGLPDQVLASRRLPNAVKLSLTTEVPVAFATIEETLP
jgi:hypothetical protein